MRHDLNPQPPYDWWVTFCAKIPPRGSLSQKKWEEWCENHEVWPYEENSHRRGKHDPSDDYVGDYTHIISYGQHASLETVETMQKFRNRVDRILRAMKDGSEFAENEPFAPTITIPKGERPS